MNTLFRTILALIVAVFALKSFATMPSSGVMIGAGVAASMVGGKAGNLAMAGVMGVQCATGTPQTRPLYCMMAAMSVAQAGADSKSAKSGRDASKSLVPDGAWSSTDLGNGWTGAELDAKIDQYDNQLDKISTDLKPYLSNVDLSKGTFKTADGKEVPLSKLNSGKALAGAGAISADQIPAADQLLAEMAEKTKNANADSFRNIAVASGMGGGGGAGSGKSKFSIPETDYSAFFKNQQGKPNAPQTGGLVKLANGEPIGAQSDNIFNMLHNRYQRKVKEKMFVGSEL